MSPLVEIGRDGSEQSSLPVAEKKPTPSAGVPEPPALRVRTLGSDAGEIARRGGTVPSASEMGKMVRAAGSATSQNAGGILSTLTPRALIILIGFFLLMGIGVLIYSALPSSPPVEPSPPGGNGTLPPPRAQPPPPVGGPTPLPPPEPPLPPPIFEHQSFFLAPVDQTLSLVLPTGPVTDARDLKTVPQRFQNALVAATPGASLFEFKVEDERGSAISTPQFFALANAPVLGRDLLLSSFNPDFTAFAHREGTEFFLGYVLASRKEAGALALRDTVQEEIEGAAGIAELYLASPGVFVSEFRDVRLSNAPARALDFSAGATFVYGWSGNYLILSTSEKGFEVAIDHLQ